MITDRHQDTIICNFSLSLHRYNFVSPLTSLVVVEPEDLEEIEKELEKIELAKNTSAPATTTRAPETYRPYAEASYYGRGAGGFYGDPHVVIPMKGMNLCFNLEAEDGEV